MTIIIDKETDKFFIAIGKEDRHSFVMFGVYDQNKVQHLLCRVGKFFDGGNEPNANRYFSASKRLASALFSSAHAKLRSEAIVRKQKQQKEISYQAYDATYEQYIEFIQLLETLQTEKNVFLCFKPVQQNGNKVVFERTGTKLGTSNTNINHIKDNVCKLSISNTCRHSAVNLLKEVQKTPQSSLVSSGFFIDLPYKTKLNYGKPAEHIPFFVLPISPYACSGLSKAKLKVVEKLYQRMEHLLLIETHSQQTANKFNCLKSLYLNLVGSQKTLSLDELLLSIQSWKRDNKSTLSVLRKTYFWDAFFERESATMQMISKIEHDLQHAQLSVPSNK